MSSLTEPACTWPLPPEPVLLDGHEVHVWFAQLDDPDLCIQCLGMHLSSEERNRASRFKFQKDRTHYIVARGLLRSILSVYLNVHPRDLNFTYGSNGKPQLALIPKKNTIQFNLSHSDGLALYAVTRCRKVGIDIERIRPDRANDQVAERFFSPLEVDALRALPCHLRLEAFFNCWTRKEAYIKARGEGLTLPLDQFSVSLAPGEPAALLYTDGDPQEASRWSLQDLALGPDYVGALAVEGHDWRLRCWRWSE